MPLTAQQKKHYRAIGHKLNPVVIVAGNGLSEGVIEETLRALEDHELIKVKFQVGDREVKKSLIPQLCQQCDAELVQTIGNIALILKHASKPKVQLSNLTRPI
ncbi:ribosome assembly RNA-binding protein YhbY [Aestuariirhabdus litorea]|uniref:Ribosome assembly RNA-binding protein YhbY n=1 Tax=Aestuariirhabdus litorea TaxID=2528527 RepID=A0A3P3VKT7_9GAMM|nr:ribosome assembly RNA-binding protein YhbY [Aestuariirhabdus litorea]RRJ83345.1 ribosome assembly RNA-binding protein YhbY [Aestuariirhabdus litorea]RWW93504.1 ribosome assembly RNA-binding protein YhbY [Endozoicomonadaceae bacterium GTF-13]